MTKELQHYGVKGMKWGVRRAQKKTNRREKSWRKTAVSNKARSKIHNNVSSKMNSDIIPRLNNKSSYKGKNLLRNKNLYKSYMNEFNNAAAKAYADAFAEVMGDSPKNTKVNIVADVNGISAITFESGE